MPYNHHYSFKNILENNKFGSKPKIKNFLTKPVGSSGNNVLASPIS